MTVCNKITILINFMHNKGAGESGHVCILGPLAQMFPIDRDVRPNAISITQSQEFKGTLDVIATCTSGLEGSRRRAVGAHNEDEINMRRKIGKHKMEFGLLPDTGGVTLDLHAAMGDPGKMHKRSKLTMVVHTGDSSWSTN